MFYGICRLSIVPVRQEPSDKSELTTQLLFGECYEIIEHREKWLQVRLAADGYVGWIDAKQHNEVAEDFYQSYCSVKQPRLTDPVALLMTDAGPQHIAVGAVLPFLSQQKITLGAEKISCEATASSTEQVTDAQQVVDVAMKFMNAPYLWGGRTLFGIDCSGFVQMVFSLCGYQLSRDAFQQVEHGEDVHFVSLAKAGDLAFFDNADGRIVHVGMVLDEGRIIHAHGQVRIDQLDHNGIFNVTRQVYSHKLRLIRRILPDPGA